MSTRIKIAGNALELDGLFRSRHRALVEELGSHFPRADQRLLDRFDAFPTTRNVIACVGEDVVGGVRLCPHEADCALGRVFDFSANLPKDAQDG